VINGTISEKKEQAKRKRDDEQRWLQSRKDAYHKFIEVFSKPLVDEDIIDYLKVSLEAADYGDVILSAPLKEVPNNIQFPIETLDNLIGALIFMRSMHRLGTKEKDIVNFAYFEHDFEALRKDALTPFLNEFMNRLRQTGTLGS